LAVDIISNHPRRIPRSCPAIAASSRRSYDAGRHVLAQGQLRHCKVSGSLKSGLMMMLMLMLLMMLLLQLLMPCVNDKPREGSAVISGCCCSDGGNVLER
jgi:hypothetical protein